ncbi:Fur family transcriptional regulator [Maribacter sp. 2307ULW6-5]|uniref:Fur family transcriptional regulator n=1 Tax=Maribacter sp. 2307ULW6-5 TaxID=3386275 RepID=UPI0039BCC2D3
MTTTKDDDIIASVLTAYLNEHGHRKTTERYHILKEVYAMEGHFNVDSLYILMKNKNYRVSRATIYNTMELLVASQLVQKHQFRKGMALYEPSYFNRQHDHLIFTDTNEIKEFCDPRIQHIKDTIEKTFDITIEKHTLYCYARRHPENPKEALS